MRMRKRLLVALATVAALLLTGPVARAGADPAPAAGRPATIDWAPCEADPTAECGTLRVPIDWDRPRGPQVELALARRPATDPDARIGSLVINPGGPGASGVDFALAAPQYFSDQLLRRFDIVGFDPRGVARSHPVVCSLDLLVQMPSPVMTSQADFDELVAYNRRLGEDCREHTGPLFDHVDTLSVVRDIDAIRAALGDRRLTYYGASYGTLMGQQYAEEFPHRVRALALDSNMDHSLGTRAFLDTETVSAQESFDEFVAWCDREPGCALHGTDIRALFADLFARAQRGELAPLTDYDLVRITIAGFYGPLWFELAEFLRDLAEGEPPGPALAALATPATLTYQPDEEPDEELYPYAFPAVFCQDWHLPIRDFREFDRHLQRMARIGPDIRFSSLGLSVVSCLGWPGEVTNPQHKLRVPPGPQLLLTNARYDPATGYNWALNAARQLGRSAVLLTYEGWGHGVYGRSDCTTGATDDYLISRTLPERGASCPAVPPEPPPLAPLVAPQRPGPWLPFPS